MSNNKIIFSYVDISQKGSDDIYKSTSTWEGVEAFKNHLSTNIKSPQEPLLKEINNDIDVIKALYDKLSELDNSHQGFFYSRYYDYTSNSVS